ncbi:cytochrome c oxidase subunit 4 [Aeromicrobium sp.]|uniref:cytochrome c oxidase subunit 4 n=1 Tax=Aeromicrobium sp. TaxID=1871063 RepID=UPI002FC725D5
MKAETWTILGCGIFFALIAPIYWLLTEDPTGTSALVMTTLLCALLGFYLAVVAKQIPDRPEDRSDGEISDGAGEQGFFPPYSWWPLFAAMALAVCALGIVFGWWLFIIGAGFGAITVSGWIFEYYRGIHAH